MVSFDYISIKSHFPDWNAFFINCSIISMLFIRESVDRNDSRDPMAAWAKTFFRPKLIIHKSWTLHIYWFGVFSWTITRETWIYSLTFCFVSRWALRYNSWRIERKNSLPGSAHASAYTPLGNSAERFPILVHLPYIDVDLLYFGRWIRTFSYLFLV